MAVATATLAIAALVVGTAATGASMYSANKAASAQKKGIAEQRRQDELKANREKIQAIRQANRERARLAATATAMGVADSSGVQGGAGAIGSQLVGNLGFADTISASNNIISNFSSKAVGYANKAGLFGDVAGLAFQGANYFDTPSTTLKKA